MGTKKKGGGAASRRKGHSFERKIANDLKAIFPMSRRQLEYHTDDARGVDIQGTELFKFQCKKLKKYAPITCINEIKCDRVTEIPVLVTAGDGLEAMAILPWEELLTMISFCQNLREERLKNG